MVIGTKVRGSTGCGVNDVGLSRRHIIDSLEHSLERMGTTHIDLLQIHSPDPRTSLQETLRTLNDLVRCGKVHHVGLSNYPAWLVQKAIGLTERMGWERTHAIRLSGAFDRSHCFCGSDREHSAAVQSPVQID